MIVASNHKIPHLGQQWVEGQNNGVVMAGNWKIADIVKPLAGIIEMGEAGNRVVFDQDNSYIEHKITGQRITIDWQGHNPVIDMTVWDPIGDDLEVPSLCGMDVESSANPGASSSSSGQCKASRSSTGRWICRPNF